jgi:hypothetical protein
MEFSLAMVSNDVQKQLPAAVIIMSGDTERQVDKNLGKSVRVGPR